MRRFWALLGIVALVCVGGCRSRYVSARVLNQTGGPVSTVEVDYPSASFGRESLAAGAVYTYRFKILGSGVTKVEWTDAARKDHTSTGPELREGQEGQLTITLTPTGASWVANLEP